MKGIRTALGVFLLVFTLSTVSFADEDHGGSVRPAPRGEVGKVSGLFTANLRSDKGTLPSMEMFLSLLRVGAIASAIL